MELVNEVHKVQETLMMIPGLLIFGVLPIVVIVSIGVMLMRDIARQKRNRW